MNVKNSDSGLYYCYPYQERDRQTLENQLRVELYNDIPMKDLGVVRKVPIQWEEYIPVFDAVLLLKRTHSSWDPAAKAYMMAYDKQLKDFATMYDEEAIL
jgi:hypothetical protein